MVSQADRQEPTDKGYHTGLLGEEEPSLVFMNVSEMKRPGLNSRGANP